MLSLFQKIQIRNDENRLLADDSHEDHTLFFIEKMGKMPQNLSSAAVAIGALRVKGLNCVKLIIVSSCAYLFIFYFFEKSNDS